MWEFNSVDTIGVDFSLDVKTSFLPSDYSPLNWHTLPQSHCGKKSQSPINIETKEAMTDKHLNNFTFTKFDDKHTIKYITNTGHSG